MVAIDWGRHVPWEILKQGHHCGAKRERIVIMISVERKNLVLWIITMLGGKNFFLWKWGEKGHTTTIHHYINIERCLYISVYVLL
jgi:hypothetical protein